MNNQVICEINDSTLVRNCPICQKEIEYSSKKTLYQANNRNSICKSCRTTIANKSPLRNSKLENNSQWKGYKNIPFNWFSKYFLRGRKKRTGNITLQQVSELWDKQNGKCALSGLNINWNDDEKGHTCSIDRIDSKKEYILENVQLVHKDVNLMKNKFNNDYYIDICKLVATNRCEIKSI